MRYHYCPLWYLYYGEVCILQTWFLPAACAALTVMYCRLHTLTASAFAGYINSPPRSLNDAGTYTRPCPPVMQQRTASERWVHCCVPHDTLLQHLTHLLPLVIILRLDGLRKDVVSLPEDPQGYPHPDCVEKEQVDPPRLVC